MALAMKSLRPPPMIAGMAKSVSDSVKTTTAAATRPGRTSGSTTWRKVAAGLAPRLPEASSISSGTAVKAGASISTANGSMYWTRPSMTPGRV